LTGVVFVDWIIKRSIRRQSTSSSYFDLSLNSALFISVFNSFVNRILYFSMNFRSYSYNTLYHSFSWSSLSSRVFVEYCFPFAYTSCFYSKHFRKIYLQNKSSKSQDVCINFVAWVCTSAYFFRDFVVGSKLREFESGDWEHLQRLPDLMAVYPYL